MTERHEGEIYPVTYFYFSIVDFPGSEFRCLQARQGQIEVRDGVQHPNPTINDSTPPNPFEAINPFLEIGTFLSLPPDKIPR